jgi:hypothetical protein
MTETVIIKRKGAGPLGFEGRCSIQLSYGRLAPFSRGPGNFPLPHLNNFPAIHSVFASAPGRAAHFYPTPRPPARPVRLPSCGMCGVLVPPGHYVCSRCRENLETGWPDVATPTPVIRPAGGGR